METPGEIWSASKFKDIKFPFFGLSYTPFNIIYTKNSIQIQKYKNRSYLYVDYVTQDTLSLPYLNRLSGLDNRLEFEFTCRDLTELLNSKAIWGVDSKGKLFSLRKTQQFIRKVLPVRKYRDNLIWLNTISYPLKVSPSLDLTLVDFKILKAVVLYIDQVWVLHGFTYDLESTKKVRL